jgi:hypothetical protein
MTNTNVFTPPFDIQISKLVETMVVISRLGITYKSMVFWTILGKTFPQKLNEMENKTRALVQH